LDEEGVAGLGKVTGLKGGKNLFSAEQTEDWFWDGTVGSGLNHKKRSDDEAGSVETHHDGRTATTKSKGRGEKLQYDRKVLPSETTKIETTPNSFNRAGGLSVILHDRPKNRKGTWGF